MSLLTNQQNLLILKFSCEYLSLMTFILPWGRHGLEAKDEEIMQTYHQGILKNK